MASDHFISAIRIYLGALNGHKYYLSYTETHITLQTILNHLQPLIAPQRATFLVLQDPS